MPWPGPGYYRVSQNTWALRDDLNMTERSSKKVKLLCIFKIDGDIKHLNSFVEF